MNSFIQSSIFQFNPNANADEDTDFSAILEIHVHHARNIHNICIYDNQDVYAKFSLTYNPDDTISTKIINGGGKNPEFEEDLIMKVSQVDAVLKCEIWMLSRAKNFMEDQLLGFTLVSISSIIGKGKVTQDFNLSSTDLFHSPAGTVKLTLLLSTNLPFTHLSGNNSSSDSVADLISPELVLLDKKVPESGLDLYSRVEFPDLNVFKENQKMISEYADLSRTGLIGECSFLHLGVMHRPLNDYMNLVSPSGSLSDDQNSINSTEKTSHWDCLETPTSKKEKERGDEKEKNCSGDEEGINNERNVFPTPLGNVSLDAEQSTMQQQIVDMYMKSMHQFTESLAKMKLPMDLDIVEGNDQIQGDMIHDRDNTTELENQKKASSRVFYGSRAFF